MSASPPEAMERTEANGFDLQRARWKQLVGYDVTIWCSQSPENFRAVCEVLREIFHKWVFQQERCPTTATLHWQVRGKVYIKVTPPAFVAKWHEKLWNGFIRPTSANVHVKGTFNYVMKDDSRVDGPWTDQDTIAAPPPLTRQLRQYYELGPLPWHVTVKDDIVRQFDNRVINVIIDPRGNVAKSIFVESLEYEGLAMEIPPLMTIEDILQFCMSAPASPAYVIDLPRAMSKTRMAEFFAGIECLKNGMMYDKRYSGKKRRIDRPQVILFTNGGLDMSYLVQDRWKIWNISADKQLFDVTADFL